MLNIEKYKEEILKEYNKRLENTDEGRYSEQLANAIFDVFCCDKYKREKENVAEWAFREYKEPIHPILTEEEKRIIKDIVKAFEPFNKKPVYISKIGCFSTVGECFLEIKYEDDRTSTPNFKNDELFKGMELRKEYSLEELDL